MATTDDERVSGRFWLASNSERVVGGWLDLARRWPILELAEPLTPMYRQIAREDQPGGGAITTWEPADDDVQPATTAVHGMLRKGPRRRVTLIEAFNVSREQVIGTAVDDPGAERLEAEFALVGGHVDDADARFTQARVRFRNLDLWAHMPGIEVEIGADGRETVVRSKRPEPLSTSLTRPAGQLIVESNTPMPQLTVRGATLLRNTTLRFQSEADGLTIQELWAQLVNPISVLISLAVDADSPPVSLEVRTLSVIG